MTASIIDGKAVAEKILTLVKKEVAELSSKPSIAVVLVSDDAASQVYVRNKEKKAIECGFNSSVLILDKNISQHDLEGQIEKLNDDKGVDAILVQLPLPNHIDSYKILQKIRPDKDVDGFHPENVGKLFIGMEPYAIPCTPSGIIELLNYSNIELEGKHAVIVGRSNLVGKPLASLLLSKNATVTICHSKTKNLIDITRTADILISAIGKPYFIKAEHVKDNAVVIDVGINRLETGKLAGDVDFDNVKLKASLITPVPGGVGPMTIAMLLKNTLELHKG